MPKIFFSKKQFRDLLLLVTIGTYIKEAIDEKDGKDLKESREIADYLYKYAKEFGVEDLVENFKGSLICSEKLANLAHEYFIEEYNNDQFWHELETRLAHRDYEKYATVEEKEEVKKNDGFLFGVIDKYIKKYEDEFIEDGIKRLIIDDNKDKK